MNAEVRLRETFGEGVRVRQATEQFGCDQLKHRLGHPFGGCEQLIGSNRRRIDDFIDMRLIAICVGRRDMNDRLANERTILTDVRSSVRTLTSIAVIFVHS